MPETLDYARPTRPRNSRTNRPILVGTWAGLGSFGAAIVGLAIAAEHDPMRGLVAVVIGIPAVLIFLLLVVVPVIAFSRGVSREAGWLFAVILFSGGIVLVAGLFAATRP